MSSTLIYHFSIAIENFDQRERVRLRTERNYIAITIERNWNPNVNVLIGVVWQNCIMFTITIKACRHQQMPIPNVKANELIADWLHELPELKTITMWKPMKFSI